MNGIREGPGKLLGTITFAGFFLLVAAYYIFHKPFTPAFLLAAVESIAAIAIAISITSIAGGIGYRILPLSDLNPLVRLSVQAGIGFGVIGIGGLIAGWLGAFTRLLAWLVLAAGIIVLRRQVAEWWRSWSALKLFTSDLDGTCKAIGLLIMMVLLLTAAIALAPPLKFDTLVYHLALPAQYINAGRLVYVADNIFWGMPQAGEMSFTWAMLLLNSRSAILVGWFWGLLTIIGLLGAIGDKFGKKAAYIGIAALMCGYSLSAGLSWGYVDWLAMLFGFCFLVSLAEYEQQSSKLWLITSAVFAGFALGTKYTSGILFFTGILFMLWHKAPGEKTHRRLAACLTWTITAVLIASPWLIKNYLATGNPAYPFFFPSGAMDSYRLEHYRGLPVESLWQTLALLPVRATLTGAEARPGYGASIGPLLLGFSMSVFLGWKKMSLIQRGAAKSALWLVLPGVAAWMIASRFSDFLLQSRLYFSVFPALTVLAGAGFHNLEDYSTDRIKLGWIAGVASVFVLGLTVLEVAQSTVKQGTWQVLLGVQSRDEYLRENLGWYHLAMQAVKGLPDGSKVLMLWEPRAYDCLPRCVPDEILDRWLQLRDTASTSSTDNNDEILIAWRKNGFTHLLVNSFGAEFVRREENEGYQPEDWIALENLVKGLALVQEFGSSYYLYSLSP